MMHTWDHNFKHVDGTCISTSKVLEICSRKNILTNWYKGVLILLTHIIAQINALPEVSPILGEKHELVLSLLVMSGRNKWRLL